MTGGCKDIVENVTELLPYQDEICAQIPFVYNQCENQDYKYSLIDDCKADNSVFTIICTLTNLEDKAGDFSVSYGIINKTGERNGGKRQSCWNLNRLILSNSRRMLWWGIAIVN